MTAHSRNKGRRAELAVVRLLADDVSLDRAYRELSDPRSRPTPEVTIEAILHCVRKRGLSALKEPANVERLARCDAHAREEINKQIQKIEGHTP
jgi:hypothetical protein